jgi:hypothetical protein
MVVVMSTQPEALRLAKELELVHQGHADEGPSTFSEAAAELRRLHSVNAELLEALRKFALKHRHTYGLDGAWDEEITIAENAIAKATGETK